MIEEFAWLDTVQAPLTGLENRAEIMRPDGQNGKDRIWWTDGEYVWFRRSKSNPETLKRHNDFVATGDYRHIETQDDIEIYQLQPKSPFKLSRQIDIGQMNRYNIRRQAALAACRRDWQAFRDIMSFLRERINAVGACSNTPGQVTPLAESMYAEEYMAVILSIEQRDGPSAGEINREIHALSQRHGASKHKFISISSKTGG